jgi:hypothetical protein
MDDHFIAAIGPCWSHWAGRSWSLFLAPDRIIAVPYSCRESLQLGLRFSVHVWPRDPGEDARALVQRGIDEEALPRGRRFRRYPVHLVRSITLQSNNLANTLAIRKVSGEEDVYAIALHHETDAYRELFADLYPSLYTEMDFPTSSLGRLLRK